MNWSAISAVADLIASIAVIVSLIYVGVQVRQNTRTGRSTAAVVSNQAHSSFNQFLGGPGGLQGMVEGPGRAGQTHR